MSMKTYESPQYCSLSEPVALTMLSMSVATVAVETCDATFSALISASFPRILLLTYKSLNADEDALRLEGVSTVNFAASMVVLKTLSPGVVKPTPSNVHN